LGGRLGSATDTVLISVGGVANAEDVWARLQAGAALVQGYTGFVYAGPLWARSINRELAAKVRAGGHKSVAEARDAAAGARTSAPA
jgi:dihydroorotate dehydrogenase